MEDIQPVEVDDDAISFFEQHVKSHGGVEIFRNQYFNHLLDDEETLLGSVTYNLYEAARSGQHDFQDEADLDARAFIEGFAFGVGIIANFNSHRQMLVSRDTYHHVSSNILDTCDSLRKYNGVDPKPIDILHATSKLGYKLFGRLEDYINELLQDNQLQPDATRVSHTRAGVGFAANYFASLEHLDRKTEDFEKLRPSEEDWNRFIKENLGND